MLVATDGFLLWRPGLNLRVVMQGIVTVTIFDRVMADKHLNPKFTVANI
jgi:hypothetical protein